MSIRHLRNAIIASMLMLAPVAPSARAQGSAPATEQFTIMIWETPAQLALRTDRSAKGGAYWTAFADYGAALQKAGILRGGTALRTGADVRTVTVRRGSSQVVPNAHLRATTELGGYFIIEVASLDEAVRWAERLPSAVTGAVEVRPAYPAPTMMK